MFKVSVIVPVYNGEKYIDRCMKCLVQQSLKELELIAVNDASTDRSAQYLENWRRQYPENIRVISLQANRGAGGARNLGISLAEGEYIGFMDCDDEIDGSMFEELYNKAAQEDCDIVDCGYYEESTGISVLSFDDDVTGNLDDEKRGKIISGMGYSVTKIFRASLLKENNCLIREGVIYEDADFLIQAVLSAKKTGNVKSVLYYYRNNEQSSSKIQNEQKKFDDMLSAMQAVDLLKRQNPAAGANTIQAMEYVMLSCLSCAIGMCLMNQDNAAFRLTDNLRRLKKMSAGGCANWQNNIYLDKYMPDESKEILRWFETVG
jgi:glycosyltransferase involved in cell wall biosynthesis